MSPIARPAPARFARASCPPALPLRHLPLTAAAVIIPPMRDRPTTPPPAESAADLLRRCDFARLRPARAAALLEEALAKAPAPKKEAALVD